MIAAAGVVALGLYGFAATLQPSAEFGRILAAYGGVFIVGSMAWGWPSTASDPTASTSSAPWSAWLGSA